MITQPDTSLPVRSSEGVAIVGGGLAGLALGIGLLGRGVPVSLSEAGSYPRHRVCGEFMNGVTRATLRRLGVEDVLSDARRHSATRWFRHGLEIYRNTLPAPALSLSRYVLDDRMQRRFRELGGILHTGCRVRAEPFDGLVWAAGRPAQRDGRWIGLKCHVEGLEVSGDLEMHLGDGAYLGMTPVEAGRVNVCGLFPAGRIAEGKTKSALLIAALRNHDLGGLANKLEAARCLDDTFVGAAGFALGAQSPIPGLCQLGDAEAITPPFTGNGMSMALEAAESALDPLTAFARGESSWRRVCDQVHAALSARFRTRLGVARLLHPLLLRPTGQRILAGACRTRMIPFRPLHALLT